MVIRNNHWYIQHCECISKTLCWVKKAGRKQLHILCFHSYGFLEKVKLWGKKQMKDFQGLGERGEVKLEGMQKNLWKQEKYSIPWLSWWLHYCTCFSNFIKLYTNKVSILLQINFIPQYIWLIKKRYGIHETWIGSYF